MNGMAVAAGISNAKPLDYKPPMADNSQLLKHTLKPCDTLAEVSPLHAIVYRVIMVPMELARSDLTGQKIGTSPRTCISTRR